MVKIYSFVTAALLSILSFSSNAQDIPNQQGALLTKVTATWCPPCGGWGWDLFEGLVEDNEQSNGVFIAAHWSGDLQTTTANELANNFGFSGQPQFYLNNNNQSASTSNSATKRSEITSEITSLNSTTSVANATLRGTNTGTDFDLFAEIEFFEEATGDFYVSVLVIEDNIINNQANRSSTANHLRVLRGSLGASTAFGQPLMSGTVAAGQTFSIPFAGEMSNISDINNVTLAVAIWNKVNDVYQFVNINEVEQWENSSSTAELGSVDYRITSFSESGQLTTRLDLGLSAKQSRLDLIDAQGRLIETQYLGDLPSGLTQVTWATQNLNTGFYAIRLSTAIGSRSEAVVVN